MEAFAWMAWTWQTAVFFAAIASLLGVMTLLAIGIATTRGDRLFISLVGSAFIHLAWLGLLGPELWWASALSLVYAFVVFRKA